MLWTEAVEMVTVGALYVPAQKVGVAEGGHGTLCPLLVICFSVANSSPTVPRSDCVGQATRGTCRSR